MKKLLIATAIGLVSSIGAHAAAGKVVVQCGDTSFSDLKSIVIQETDLDGQYQIVENGTRLSPVFGMNEIEKSEFPDLSGWNGYTRRLIRYGRDRYAISTFDECSGGVSTVACKETF